MPCADALRVQAYFDGELDALSTADIERHCETCSGCRELLEDLGSIRAALRRDLPYASAPPALRARIMNSLDQESALESPRIEDGRTTTPPTGGLTTGGLLTSGATTSGLSTNGRTLSGARTRQVFTGARVRPFWAGAFSGIGGTAIAAGIAFFLLAPVNNPLLDDLVSAHVRSLMPEHLIDVVSTDKHTVKPWFAGHTDVSPVVADFEAQGYRLMGGRADYFDHQRAAVVVYQHGPHVINVFSWAADEHGVPKNTTRNGYHLAFWRTGNLVYCAVSDTAWEELMRLVKLLQDANTGDAGFDEHGTRE
jgi:anti-sigma factor RsiW